VREEKNNTTAPKANREIYGKKCVGKVNHEGKPISKETIKAVKGATSVLSRLFGDLN